jgi:hypothetical protein
MWINTKLMSKTQKSDSLLVLEPHCVCPNSYNPQFTKRFKKVFNWTPHPQESKSDNFVLINHPTWDGVIPKNIYKKGQCGWGKREDKVVMVASNKKFNRPEQLYTLRIDIMNSLYKRKTIPVVGYGVAPFKQPWFKGKIGDKRKVINNVKFVLCTENCYHPHYSFNYFTEKMFDALLAGAVPIYMGCYNIDQLNVPKSYIDLRPYVKGEKGKHILSDVNGLLNEIKSYNKEKHARLQMEVAESVAAPDGLYHLTSSAQMFHTMAKVLL